MKFDFQDQKELLKRNEKHFFLFKKCSLLDFQTGKNVLDPTFKAAVDISIWINLKVTKPQQKKFLTTSDIIKI